MSKVVFVGNVPYNIERGSQWRPESRGPEGSRILATIPHGKPLVPGERAQEAITHAIAQGMSENQLIEVLAQMKAFVITHPKKAHQFLSNHPQVAYAVFMGLIISNIFPSGILTQMLEACPHASRSAPPPPHLQPQPPPNFAPSPQLHPQHQPYPGAPPPSRLQQPQPAHGMMPGMGGPPPGAIFGHQMQPNMQPTPPGIPPMPPYYRAGPSGTPQPLPPQQPPHLPPQQPAQQVSGFHPLLQLLKDRGGNNPEVQTLYSIVLNLTPTQIIELPVSERETIESLRSMLVANPGRS
ncbi:hypothetical protein B0H14DRAFT_3448835 [Mycena olivaceomarginata]|nr:hypothetical protein B0H14DRAFT_3448835 [Mycena olivaceomarginata]